MIVANMWKFGFDWGRINNIRVIRINVVYANMDYDNQTDESCDHNAGITCECLSSSEKWITIITKECYKTHQNIPYRILQSMKILEKGQYLL